MTTTGLLALLCIVGFFIAFAGWVYVVWPREYEPNPYLMAHPERRKNRG